MMDYIYVVVIVCSGCILTTVADHKQSVSC